jgi:predicted homoserine dehydrogenase-like protein
LLGLKRRLKEYEMEGNCIRVGLIGAGQMGRGLISQVEKIAGMEVVITADIVPERAETAYRKAGVPSSSILRTDDPEKAERWIASGGWVVTRDGNMAVQLDSVDVVVDATGIPEVGAEIAWHAILNRKHIVLLNVEADVTVGPLLKKMADVAGVVYTGTAGDEPGAIMELYDFASSLGFEVIALGKGKNNPLDVYATPDGVADEARRKGVNPKMLASFRDGTKTMVEMTAVSNATGFLPDVPGMHGPKATLDRLPRLFSLREEGGILHRKGIVDYVDGVAPGVFAVITTDNPEVHDQLKYLKMGDGPHYVLYRPYHLTSLETPISVARAFFHQEPTIAPCCGSVSETVAVAKKDLQPGEALDGIGGYTVYGRILSAEEQRRERALPIGLVGANVRMKRRVKKGEILTYDDVECEERNRIWILREFMEKDGQ